MMQASPIALDDAIKMACKIPKSQNVIEVIQNEGIVQEEKPVAIDMSEVIHQLMQDRNMSEELILKTIENTLLAAYKRRYGNADNAIVRFSDDNREVSIYAKKDNR